MLNKSILFFGEMNLVEISLELKCTLVLSRALALKSTAELALVLDTIWIHNPSFVYKRLRLSNLN